MDEAMSESQTLKQSLAHELGVTKEQTALLVGLPEATDAFDCLTHFETQVIASTPLEKEFELELAMGPFDYIHCFEQHVEILEAILPRLRDALAAGGMIWISWPNKESHLPTSITDNLVRRLATEAELIEIKTFSIDNIWQGIKLVIPKLSGTAHLSSGKFVSF